MRRYLDGLVSILEGYLMTFSTILITIGISFSMYDFLSGGTALNDPNVFKVWAIVQTVAIDAQFVNMWYRLKVSLREEKRWQAGGYLVLGVTLAFVTFGASVIPALQKSLGLNFDAAILQAGLNPTAMIWARSFVAILLAIIGAFQRTVIVFDKSGQIKNTEQKSNTATPVKTSVKQPGFFARKYTQITALLAKKSNRSQDPNEVVTDGGEPALQVQLVEVQPEVKTEPLTSASKETKQQKPEATPVVGSIITPPQREEPITDPELDTANVTTFPVSGSTKGPKTTVKLSDIPVAIDINSRRKPLTTSEAMTILGVSEKTVREWKKSGKLVASADGKMITASSVRRMIESRQERVS